MTETTSKDRTKPFTLPSGAVLHVGRPAFADAGRLRNAIARAAGAKPLSADEMKVGFSQLSENPSAGGALLQRALTVISSDEVERCLFECLQSASYQPKGSNARIKVNPELFDDERFGDDARKDYYPICARAVEVAVGPFLGPLVSMYMEFLKKVGQSLASQPTSAPKGS